MKIFLHWMVTLKFFIYNSLKSKRHLLLLAIFTLTVSGLIGICSHRIMGLETLNQILVGVRCAKGILTSTTDSKIYIVDVCYARLKDLNWEILDCVFFCLYFFCCCFSFLFFCSRWDKTKCSFVICTIVVNGRVKKNYHTSNWLFGISTEVCQNATWFPRGKKVHVKAWKQIAQTPGNGYGRWPALQTVFRQTFLFVTWIVPIEYILIFQNGLTVWIKVKTV